MPEYSLTIVQGKGNEKVFAHKIEVGLKVEVKEEILNILKNDTYIQDYFTLNIRRLNRWWYSVYFDKKCKHLNEPIVNGESYFCPDCGMKLE